MQITYDAMLQELRRELAMRQKVYPDWIKQGKLSIKRAEFRIQALQEAIEILEECRPLDPVQPNLFEEPS